MSDATVATADEVLSFWFPQDHGDDVEAWKAQAMRWFRGGMDEGIIARFRPTLDAALRGELDDWASSPHGRLALILVLDQFPRSIHAGTPAAYSSDPLALQQALDGLANGEHEALDPWQQVFFTLPLVHAEGPDHLERLDRLIEIADALYERGSDALRPMWDFNRGQPRRVREVIERFGRHPHRNAILGRESTPEEQEYLDAGVFPHSSAPAGTVFAQ